MQRETQSPVKTVSADEAWDGTGPVEIERDSWRSFLDTFSLQHQGWRVIVEVSDGEGNKVLAEERPLTGVSFDNATGEPHAYVEIAVRDEHLTHIIENPKRIRFERTESGAHSGLTIEAADGTTTRVRFRVPVAPEMLDGRAA